MSVAGFVEELRKGATLSGAASRSGVSTELARALVDDLSRRGLVSNATSLCASGLGMCHGNISSAAKITCTGCPLTR